MEFKIDTKPTYSIITPVSNVVDANLTEALRQKWKDLRQTGSGNMIVDLHNFIQGEEPAILALADLHEEVYGTGHSLIFTNIQEEVLDLLKEKALDLQLNIAPTVIEAVDIVSMEILERDLFDEES